ncbi:MAG: 23S rRNA (pseudouridine(1915)-N(3))-methyltransferase RlmH [bacterium]
MFDILIIAFGKLKKTFHQEEFAEYIKYAKPFARVAVLELPAEAFDESNKEKIKKVEGEKLTRALEKYTGASVFFLQEDGKKMDSLKFAELLKNNGSQKIIFVIGGALGIDRQIANKPTAYLSLSEMTFNHELARVMLSEQVFRALTIIHNKNYHY